MQQFTRLNRADIVGSDRNQSHRLPAAVDELDFVAFAFFVDVNHRTDIAAVQLRVRRLAVQDDKGMFGNHCE